MRHRHGRSQCLALLCGGLALPALGAAPATDLFAMSLQELINIPTETASRQRQSARAAPAIISVITADDIDRFGYRSVAEALAQVPGMVDLYDGLGHNVGVRGINAGLRAYSRILKVMLDGLPLAFRTDATNLLGPELLNMAAIERIEVVRGPASALYGADAFLGVINIITRTADSAGDANRVTLARLAGAETGGALAVQGGGQSARWQWLASATAANTDRGGLALPPSSPRYARAAARGAVSQDDLSRPRNAFAKLAYQSEASDTVLLLHAYRLDSMAEFLDFGILSHQNRIALNAHSARLQHAYRGLPDWTLRASVAETGGGPDARERLSLGAATGIPERSFGFHARSVTLDALYAPDTGTSVGFGADLGIEHEQALKNYDLNLASGKRTLLAASAVPATARNRGLYLQYGVRPWEAVGLTANLRQDRHSVFGSNTNYRLGVVGEIGADLSYKLLYGSSYKAPSTLQLYAQPLYAGDLLGNPRLKPETSTSAEAGLDWQLSSQLACSANVYLLTVRDKIELLPLGANVQSQNSGRQRGHGLEAELTWQTDAHRVRAQLAWADTDNEDQPRLQPLQVTPTARYPRLSAHLSWQYLSPHWGALALSARLLSPRRASAANSLENRLLPYQLPSYALAELSWQKQFGRHALALRVVNLFDRRYAEPGYAGIDLPGVGRTATLSYTYHY
jgi:outer membrane receptor for ferrienterochelin and colicin